MKVCSCQAYRLSVVLLCLLSLPVEFATVGLALVGGVAVWLAGHAYLSWLGLRQWITMGVDIHSLIHSLDMQRYAAHPWWVRRACLLVM
jgi:hypothetical protein